MFALFAGVAHVKQELGKHEHGRCGGFFGFKPDFFGLNIDQSFVVFFEPQRLDVGIFDVFFGFDLLGLAVKAHGFLCCGVQWRFPCGGGIVAHSILRSLYKGLEYLASEKAVLKGEMMRKFWLLILLLVSVPTLAAPTFADYKVEVFKGKTHAAMITPETREFRTRFREAAKEPVNFAGHFVVESFGCGTSCIGFLMVEAKTGKTSFPLHSLLGCMGMNTPELDRVVAFYPNSRLLVLGGMFEGASEIGEKEGCWVRYYLERRGELVKIAEEPYTKPLKFAKP